MQPLDPITGKALEVAQKLQVISCLQDQALSAEQLAERTECASRGVEALLMLLASAGYLDHHEGRFSLAAGLVEYLKTDWHAEWTAFPPIPEYQELEQAIRTGGPVRSAVEGPEDDGKFYSEVTPALFALHLPDAEALSRSVDPTIRRVLDLGAGSAVWSIPLAKARPSVRVTAVDRARVLSEVTAGFLARHGVSQQYKTQAGDYHRVEFEEGAFDLVILGHLLHADGWEGSRRLLARCKQALVGGGTLAVAEFVAPEARDQDYQASVFHLNMVMLTERGVVFTASELEQLATQAGFRDLEWIQGPGTYPVLLARS